MLEKDSMNMGIKKKSCKYYQSAFQYFKKKKAFIKEIKEGVLSKETLEKKKEDIKKFLYDKIISKKAFSLSLQYISMK